MRGLLPQYRLYPTYPDKLDSDIEEYPDSAILSKLTDQRFRRITLKSNTHAFCQKKYLHLDNSINEDDLGLDIPMNI